MSVENLIEAIRAGDVQRVREVFESGVNPFDRNEFGKSAFDVWFENQKHGGPHSVNIGEVIFQKQPQNENEFKAFNDLVQKQVSLYAFTNGQHEQMIKMGVNPSLAHTTNQSFSHSLACWNVVSNAHESYYGRSPVVNVGSYLINHLNGSFSIPQIVSNVVGGVPLFKENVSVTKVPEDVLLKKVQDFQDRYGNTIKITDKGAITHTRSLQPNQNVLSGDLEQALSLVLHEKDWQAAKRLVAGGANIHRLPGGENELVKHFHSTTSKQDVKNLIDLGVDVDRVVSRPGDGYAYNLLNSASNQQQFDSLYEIMKEKNPSFEADFTPMNDKTKEFWQDSPHSYQETLIESVGTKLFDAVNKLRGKTPTSPSNTYSSSKLK